MIRGLTNLKENKYLKLYENIIINRLNNPLKDCYTENHHILPKSLGGTKTQDNMVSLSAREHYICHYLLPKFLVSDSYYKMVEAFQSMNMKSKYTKNRYFNSKLYESYKIKFQETASKRSLKNWNDPKIRIKTTEAIKNSWYNGQRDSQREYMKENSPLRDTKVHKKTMETRAKRGTNIWLTNNPMKNPDKAKEVASKRSGSSHYLTKSLTYYYKNQDDHEWAKIDPNLTSQEVCDKYGWSIATFNKCINKGTVPSRGPMKGLMIKRVIDNEN